jgi:integrase
MNGKTAISDYPSKMRSEFSLEFVIQNVASSSLRPAAERCDASSVHSRRCYAFAIDRFMAWYCSEPRLTFNRAVVVRLPVTPGRSQPVHLYDQFASFSHPKIGGRVRGEWLANARTGDWNPSGSRGEETRTQNRQLALAEASGGTRECCSKTGLLGCRDGAIIGLLLGCGLRRSEVVGLTLEQLQIREGRWVIVDLIGKGRRLRTVPSWSKQLLDAWLSHSGVGEGRVFRRVSKVGRRQEAGVTANVVWYAVKRCARQAGIPHLAPHDLRRYAESRIMPNRV